MDFITKNLAEVIGRDELKEKIDCKRTLTAYWGTEPTGDPSLGYLIPMLKIKDLIDANVYVSILIADVHAFLNKGPDEIDKTEFRSRYYKFLIKLILDQLGINEKRYEFVQGSDIQLDSRYVIDLYKFMSRITVNQAKKAGSEVVKQNKDPLVSSIVYPLMQVLDETVIDADIQLGGMDQRKIFALSRDFIEGLGYKKLSYLLNHLLPSLKKPGSKMSSSDSMSKICFTDTEEEIAEKIKKAFCKDKDINIDKSPCLALAKYICYPLGHKMHEYNTYNELQDAWKGGLFRAQHLKGYLSNAIEDIIAPIREQIEKNMDMYENAFEPLDRIMRKRKLQDDQKNKELEDQKTKDIETKIIDCTNNTIKDDTEKLSDSVEITKKLVAEAKAEIDNNEVILP